MSTGYWSSSPPLALNLISAPPTNASGSASQFSHTSSPSSLPNYASSGPNAILSQTLASAPSQPGGAFPYIPPTDEERKRKPWKYKGYPALAEWMGSSSDLFVCRRFNRLHARVQLDWQDEIVRHETRLDKLDEECRRMPLTELYKGRSSSVRPDHDPRPERQEIVRKLRSLLKEYDEFILSYSQLRARSTAEEFQVKNVKAWFWNNPNAIDQDERQFIDQGGDVISLVEKQKPFLRKLIERIDAQILAKLFSVKDRVDRIKSETTSYASNSKIDVALTATIVIMGLVVLLGPMWWLDHVDDGDTRLAIITGFIVLFALILASATIQRPFEVLAGTAAYAAVLIVFLQQANGPSM